VVFFADEFGVAMSCEFQFWCERLRSAEVDYCRRLRCVNNQGAKRNPVKGAKRYVSASSIL